MKRILSTLFGLFYLISLMFLVGPVYGQSDLIDCSKIINDVWTSPGGKLSGLKYTLGRENGGKCDVKNTQNSHQTFLLEVTYFDSLDSAHEMMLELKKNEKSDFNILYDENLFYGGTTRNVAGSGSVSGQTVMGNNYAHSVLVYGNCVLEQTYFGDGDVIFPGITPEQFMNDWVDSNKRALENITGRPDVRNFCRESVGFLSKSESLIGGFNPIILGLGKYGGVVLLVSIGVGVFLKLRKMK